MRKFNPNVTYMILLIVVILSFVSGVVAVLSKAYGKEESVKVMTKEDYKKGLPLFLIVMAIGLVINVVFLNVMFPKN